MRRQVPAAPSAWDSLPGGGTDTAAWVLLGCSGAREVGDGGVKVSGPREDTEGDLSTTLKKFPVQRAHLGAGREPALGRPALPSVGPFGSGQGDTEAVTPRGLT